MRSAAYAGIAWSKLEQAIRGRCLEKLRSIVGDGVDGGSDRVAGEYVVGGGSQQGCSLGRVFVLGGQASVPVARLQDGRHAMVEGRHVGIGRSGNDGERGSIFGV